ncbi:MAG: PAS domain S-box protein [Chloroflexi bacterium]|nr:PAS domain S-box protein [Chloroflexota bacterium]
MRRTILFLVVIFLSLSQMGWTPLPQQTRTIRVGAYENAPKIFTADDGTVSGFWPELIRDIAAQEGWEIVWVHGTWGEGLERLAANQIDIMPDTAWTEERSQQFAFSNETVLISWTRLYVPKGSTIESLVDLEGKTIAGLAGSINLNGPEGIKDLTTRFGVHSTFVEMDNYTQVFEALDNKKVDAGITNKDFGNLNEGKYNVVKTSIIFQPAHIQFAFTKNAQLTPYLIGIIDTRIKSLKADPDSIYYQALDQYLGKKASGVIVEVLPGWLKNLLLLGGGIILFLLAVGITSRVQVRQRTAELQKQRTLLQAVIDGTTDAIFAKDTQGRYILYNAGTELMTGKPAKDVLGQDDHFLFPVEAETIIVNDRRIMAGGQATTYEETLPDVNGQLRTFLTTKGPLLDKRGEVIGLFGMARDITERAQAEEELRRWEQMLQSAGWGVVLANPADDVILAANPAFARMHGYEPGEMIGLNLADTFATEARPDLSAHTRLAQERGHHTYESIHIRKDGSRFPTIADVNVVKDRDGKVLYRAANVQDITARKQAEKELRESKERYRTLARISPVGIFRTDAAGHTTYVNPMWCHISGLSVNEALGEGWLKAVHPEDRKNLDIGWQESTRLHNASLADYRFVRPDGTIAWVMGQAVPEMNSDNQVVGYVGTITDITERKRAEEELRRRAEELAALNALGKQVSRTLSVGEVVADAVEEIVKAVQPDLAFVFLREEERLLLKGIGPASAQDTFKEVPEHRVGECMCGLAVRDGKALYARDIFADVRCTWTECKRAGLRSFAALPLHSGDEIIGVLGLAARGERDFEQEATFLDTLASQTAVGIRNALLYEQAGRRFTELVAVHQAGQRLRYLAAPEQVAQEIIRVLENVVGYDYGAVLLIGEGTDRLLPFALSEQGRDPTFLEADKEYVASHAPRLGEGITGWVAQTGQSVRLDDVRQDARYRALRADIRSELCVPLNVGEKIIGVVNVEATRPNAYTEADQRVLETVAAQIGIAIQNARLLEEVQRHAAELERRVAERTAQLQTANADLEAFSYSVSHDLRAPLRAVSGFAQILANRHRASLNAEGQHYMDNIVQAADRMNRLINDLLAYSRLGRRGLTLRPVSLREIVGQIAGELAGRAAEIGATLEIADDLPVVRGDATLLSQVFTNLLDNALTYRRPDVPPRVAITWQTQNGHVIVRVSDNGIGIAAEYHEKIFNVFQRLHSEDAYPGTGIGLAIVKKSVELLGGRIWVESAIDEGSAFSVQLLIAD